MLIVCARHKRRGLQPRNDGTKDQGVREVHEHRHSRVPASWHRESPDRRTDENVPHHERAQIGSRTSMAK